MTYKLTLFAALLLTAVLREYADDTSPATDLIAKATQGDLTAQLSLSYSYRDGKGIVQLYAR